MYSDVTHIPRDSDGRMDAIVSILNLRGLKKLLLNGFRFKIGLHLSGFSGVRKKDEQKRSLLSCSLAGRMASFFKRSAISESLQSPPLCGICGMSACDGAGTLRVSYGEKTCCCPASLDLIDLCRRVANHGKNCRLVSLVSWNPNFFVDLGVV